MTSLVVRARKVIRQIIRGFELDGFTVTWIAGFIPLPAPQFRRKRTRNARPKVRAMVKRAEPRKDPVVDTFEKFRQDAIDEGEYGAAFGAALFQSWYEQGKRRSQGLP